MDREEKINITSGVNLNTYFTDKFKTSILSVFIHTPLKKEQTTVNRLLLKLLSSSSDKYKTAKLAEQKKAELYGVSLSEGCIKNGDTQILSISLDFIANSYTMNGEDLSAEVASFLMTLLTEPKFDENEYFYDEDIEREKRLLKNELEGIFNDKRKYALENGISLLFKDEPYGISANGSIDEIEKITKEDLKKAYFDLITTSAIEFIYVGDESKTVETTIKSVFKNINRTPKITVLSDYYGKTVDFSSDCEKFDLTQSKIVMGFRAKTLFDEFDPKKYVILNLMNAIFGGGTYSKLFMNVREKESLCYYCSSQVITNRFALIVQSGVEDKNVELAEKSILKEFENLKSGKITDDELEFAKIAFDNMFRGFYDSPEMIESLLLQKSQIPGFEIGKLIDLSKEIEKEDLQKAASEFEYSLRYEIRSQGNK